METLKEFVLRTGQFVVAHRGSSGTAPENTLSAFKEAIETGAAMIETDIQFTADNRIISFHDFYLDRTSSGTGLTGISDYESLKTLDAGKWFDDKFAGERIPLIEEVIELIRDKAYLNIEIKSYDKNDAKQKITHLVNTIINLDYGQKTLFSSFDYNMLKLIKESFPNLHTAAIKIPGDTRLPSEIAKATGCESFVCSIDEISHEISEDTSNAGLFVGVYSIDTPEQLEFIKGFDIKAIVTNYPRRIISILNRQ